MRRLPRTAAQIAALLKAARYPAPRWPLALKKAWLIRRIHEHFNLFCFNQPLRTPERNLALGLGELLNLRLREPDHFVIDRNAVGGVRFPNVTLDRNC